MSRVKVILGVVAVVVTSFAAFPSSAMADTIICTDSGCNNVGQISQEVAHSGIASSTISVSSGTNS